MRYLECFSLKREYFDLTLCRGGKTHRDSDKETPCSGCTWFHLYIQNISLYREQISNIGASVRTLIGTQWANNMKVNSETKSEHSNNRLKKRGIGQKCPRPWKVPSHFQTALIFCQITRQKCLKKKTNKTGLTFWKSDRSSQRQNTHTHRFSHMLRLKFTAVLQSQILKI